MQHYYGKIVDNYISHKYDPNNFVNFIQLIIIGCFGNKRDYSVHAIMYNIRLSSLKLLQRLSRYFGSRDPYSVRTRVEATPDTLANEFSGESGPWAAGWFRRMTPLPPKHLITPGNPAVCNPSTVPIKPYLPWPRDFYRKIENQISSK